MEHVVLSHLQTLHQAEQTSPSLVIERSLHENLPIASWLQHRLGQQAVTGLHVGPRNIPYNSTSPHRHMQDPLLTMHPSRAGMMQEGQTSSEISTLAPSMVPTMREPFMVNFMLPVPEASVPAVLMCCDTSEPASMVLPQVIICSPGLHAGSH